MKGALVLFYARKTSDSRVCWAHDTKSHRAKPYTRSFDPAFFLFYVISRKIGETMTIFGASGCGLFSGGFFTKNSQSMHNIAKM